MDGSSNVPIFIAGGALLVSLGASWYLNNRINELEEHSAATQDRLASLIIKFTSAEERLNNIINSRANIEAHIMSLTKEIGILKEAEVKRAALFKLQSQAITEIQEVLNDIVEGGYDFKHILPSQKPSKKISKKPSKHSSYTSEDVETTPDPSDDEDETADDVEEVMKKTKNSSRRSVRSGD